jgi:transposase-like protein
MANPQAGGQQAGLLQILQVANNTNAQLGQQTAAIAQANVDAAAAAAVRAIRKEWLDDERSKVDTCEGAPTGAMRRWLRDVTDALERIPVIQPANQQIQAARVLGWGKALISKTASRDLRKEADRVLGANVGYTCAQVLQDLQDTFLGADEPAAKKAELEKMKQKCDIPLYCRRFGEAADEAYAIIGRNPETEEKLAELFICSLRDNDVIEELFKHVPRLVTLAAAQNEARHIYDRQKHMSRVWKRRAQRQEEPMECGPLTTAERIELSNMRKRLAELEKALAAQKAATIPTGIARGGSSSHGRGRGVARSHDSYTGPRTAGPKAQCFSCKNLGHFARDCPAQVTKGEAAAAPQH